VIALTTVSWLGNTHVRDACVQLVSETAEVGGEIHLVYASTTDFQLVPLHSEPDRDAIAAFYSQGLSYCGLLATTKVGVKVAVRHDGNADHLQAMHHAGVTFARQRVGDSIEWLEKLWSLPDVRVESTEATDA